MKHRRFSCQHVNIGRGLALISIKGHILSRESIKNNISPNRNKKVLEEHQRIIDAIELHDQEAARLAMRNHIARIKQRLINAQEGKV